MSVLPTKLSMLIKKKKQNYLFLFVALYGFSLVVASLGYSSLPCAGCSLWWLLLLQSTGSGPTGISSGGWQALEHALGEGNDNPLQYSCLENPVDREVWWVAVHRVAQSRTWLKQLSMHACVAEGNGNPLQYSCLETLRDRGAWWAAVCGVAQSPT